MHLYFISKVYKNPVYFFKEKIYRIRYASFNFNQTFYYQIFVEIAFSKVLCSYSDFSVFNVKKGSLFGLFSFQDSCSQILCVCKRNFYRKCGIKIRESAWIYFKLSHDKTSGLYSKFMFVHFSSLPNNKNLVK